MLLLRRAIALVAAAAAKERKFTLASPRPLCQDRSRELTRIGSRREPAASLRASERASERCAFSAHMCRKMCTLRAHVHSARAPSAAPPLGAHVRANCAHAQPKQTRRRLARRRRRSEPLASIIVPVSSRAEQSAL